MRPAPVMTTKWKSVLPWLMVLGIWWIWTLTPFYGVNITTNDQVKWALEANERPYDYVVKEAKGGGRIYGLATYAGLLLGSLAPDRPVSKWLLLIAFAVTPLCFAYLMYPTHGPRLLFVWVYAGLVWAGWNHLPPAAWASLAYLPFLFWAAAAWIVRSQSKPGGNEAVALLFFALAVFCAYFQYESITALSMVGFGWLLLSTPLPETTRKKFWWTLAGTTLFYLAIYVSWRANYSSGYSGNNAASFSLFETVRVTIAYTIGGLPFSEHFWASNGWRSRNIIEAVFRTGAFSIALYIAAAVAVYALYSLTEDGRGSGSVNRSGTRVAYHQSGWFWWAMILTMFLAINGPLGLTDKYRGWASGWDATYFTSGIALLPICLGVVWLLERCYRGALFERVRPMFLLLVALIAIGGTVVRAHNEQVTSRQHWSVSRWEALRVISFGDQIWGSGPFVAPEFFYTYHANNSKTDWSEYWARYSKARFGVQIQFLDDFPQVAERRPGRIELHHLDNGRLRALTVQTGSKLFVIAKPQHRPRSLLSENRLERLKRRRWRRAQKIPGTDYQYLEFDEPDNVTNPLKWVDLAWFRMDGKYVRPKNQPYAYSIP